MLIITDTSLHSAPVKWLLRHIHEFAPVINLYKLDEYKKWGITLDCLVDLKSLGLIEMDSGITNGYSLVSNEFPAKVIASSTELFSELRECDLIDFISNLATGPELALEHPMGRKIYDIIQSWNTYMDFDKDEYFHARTMKENAFPYTADEMGSAPNLYVQAGRYNHKNQSHYYFADTFKGAWEEVRRHSPNAKIQVARLKPRRTVKLIDFSDRTTKYNSFLQLIRKPVENLNKPTEYLLPEYVTTCCRKTEIEGIKYFGGREYDNYVTWNDGYFNVELIP